MGRAPLAGSSLRLYPWGVGATASKGTDGGSASRRESHDEHATSVAIVYVRRTERKSTEQVRGARRARMGPKTRGRGALWEARCQYAGLQPYWERLGVGD